MNQKIIKQEKKNTNVLVVGISGQRSYDFFSRYGENLKVDARLARSFEESVCILQCGCFDVVWVDAPLFRAGERTWIDEIRDFHGGWLIWSGKRPVDSEDETDTVQCGVDVCLFTSDSPQINDVSCITVFRHIDMCHSIGKPLSTVTRKIYAKNASRGIAGQPCQNGKLSVGLTPSDVYIEGCGVDLDWEEFVLLRLLVRHQGNTVHRRFLQQWLFGAEGEDVEQNLVSRIVALRKKLGDNPHAPAWIESVCDSGYRMNTFN